MSPALLMSPSPTHTHSFDCTAVTTATTDEGTLLHCRPGQTSAVQCTRSSAASTCSTLSLIPEPLYLSASLLLSCLTQLHGQHYSHSLRGGKWLVWGCSRAEEHFKAAFLIKNCHRFPSSRRMSVPIKRRIANKPNKISNLTFSSDINLKQLKQTKKKHPTKFKLEKTKTTIFQKQEGA